MANLTESFFDNSVVSLSLGSMLLSIGVAHRDFKIILKRYNQRLIFFITNNSCKTEACLIKISKNVGEYTTVRFGSLADAPLIQLFDS